MEKLRPDRSTLSAFGRETRRGFCESKLRENGSRGPTEVLKSYSVMAWNMAGSSSLSGLEKNSFFLIRRKIRLFALWIKSKFTFPGGPSPKEIGEVKKILSDTCGRVEFPKTWGFNSRALWRSERGWAWTETKTPKFEFRLISWARLRASRWEKVFHLPGNKRTFLLLPGFPTLDRSCWMNRAAVLL